MGNTGSSTIDNGHRRNSRHHHHIHLPPFGASDAPPLPPQPQLQPQQPEIVAQYPNPYFPYGYYPSPSPAMPVPLPAPLDHHQRREYPFHHPGWANGGRYPYGAPLPAPAPAPYVDHHKAVTIRNDVNIKKETLRVEPDEQNPGQFLVAFTFDATVAGSWLRVETVGSSAIPCMCRECAKVLRFQTNRCPMCRQLVEQLLEIKIHNRPEKPQER
ncbi:hypothetical protein C4D60_Mb11t00330 [Musa balbisiana]|uniref:RING-type E3 ubiquitin transferase n=1 Tax=Musa balbisiana TaxID=52838 RepID=A0A4S8J0Q1_MUSBA|nr:hypothetical protein C4D60_Mb11t00330 [Musa balbisiana]